jgi:hypothetical protein
MSDEEARVTDRLNEKIKSKMDVTKFFTGFITLLIGFLLNGGRLSPTFSKIGIVLLISSLSFCVAAMLTYDHLLWPKEHFADSSAGKISEANFRKYLETKMVDLWWCLFVPAIVLFGIGFLFLLMPELGLTNRCESQENASKIWMVFLGVAVGLPILLCCLRWPRMDKGKAPA